ncbi:MAG TPA: DinB family protein, partial [Chthonomonadales bacterium]|nr:DinB family protein [Chthonomonadales bacterium]
DTKFEIGNRSLRGTFVHALECLELHTDRMLGRPDRELLDDYSLELLMDRLTGASKELVELALRVERDRTEDAMWCGASGDKRTFGAGIAHVLTHKMHHRAQALYMIEKLGPGDFIEGDVLGWESVARGWGWAGGGSAGRIGAE